MTSFVGLGELRNRKLKWMPDFLRKKRIGGGEEQAVHLGGRVERGHVNCASEQSKSTGILCQHGKVDV